MNNQFTYFNPFIPIPNIIKNEQDKYNHIFNKIEELEKHVQLLEDKLNKLEKEKYKDNNDNPLDMYII